MVGRESEHLSTATLGASYRQSSSSRCGARAASMRTSRSSVRTSDMFRKDLSVRTSCLSPLCVAARTTTDSAQTEGRPTVDVAPSLLLPSACALLGQTSEQRGSWMLSVRTSVCEDLSSLTAVCCPDLQPLQTVLRRPRIGRRLRRGSFPPAHTPLPSRRGCMAPRSARCAARLNQ